MVLDSYKLLGASGEGGNRVQFTDEFITSLKKGKGSPMEACLASHAIGLLAITIGNGSTAKEIMEKSLPHLEKVISSESEALKISYMVYHGTVDSERGEAYQDETISKIEERIVAWTFLPKENGENMQILHHQINGSHAPHYDNNHKESNLVNGGNRVATILMHLSTGTRGGEEIFPESEDGRIDYGEFVAMMQKGSNMGLGRRTMRKSLNMQNSLSISMRYAPGAH